jgi:hypothetical protein
MRRRWWVLSAGVAAALAGLVLHPQSAAEKAADAPAASAFRILLGIGDTEPKVWDGTVSATGAQMLSLRGWRFSGTDAVTGLAGWRLSTRRAPATGTQTVGAMLENGVLLAITPDEATATVTVSTPQGAFSFKPSAVAWGTPSNFLKNAARVDRVPATWALTTSYEEQDFPAAAQAGDDVWVAYVEFTHSDRTQTLPSPLRQEPGNFDVLAKPVGGDQVLLLHYSKSARQWTGPIAVSAPKQDVMRAAVAVEGGGRVWVFWSANVDGNFDIYARAYAGGKWGAEQKLTTDRGVDLNPVAATDSRGRVWVAWQGFRNNNLEILATAQNQDRSGFQAETIVSNSPASDWDPAIAAAPNGEVAISWDTYDKGDYDVYVRRYMTDGTYLATIAPMLVAGSAEFEARSSVAFDAKGRLWVAYEHGGTGWGKDFGAYDTSGEALYQGHSVGVRCFQAWSQYEPADNIDNVLPSRPTAGTYGQGIVGRLLSVTWPDPTAAQNRKPNGGPGAPQMPRNSFPRLAVDAQGVVYVAFRVSSGLQNGPGTTWYEGLVYYDGAKWSGLAFIPNTDGLLDNRPALVPLANGQLLVVSATDHRQGPGPAVAATKGDNVNTDLYAAEFRLPVTAKTMQLLPRMEVAASPDPPAERAQVADMRNYMVNVGGQDLQLMRGEFHRHTEISADGGSDGPLIDAYRYLIDAAGMDWGGCCDHDNGGGREYSWWLVQKHTDAYNLGTKYVAMFAYERSVSYPEGHRNVLFTQRGIRPLPRLPVMGAATAPTHAPDTQMLYKYLRQFGGATASHTSGTDMGTDWRDNDAQLEPVVEIYQGDRQNYEMPGAPRSNTAGDSIGGWRPLGFVSLALDQGYRMGFQASSDHISTHISYANVWVTARTREALMEGVLKRRIYAATDNILADVRVGEHFMGEEFTVTDAPTFQVKLWGTARFDSVYIVRDGQYVYTARPNQAVVDFSWRDNAAPRGRTSYYYVRGEQTTGDLVWASPMWITYR